MKKCFYYKHNKESDVKLYIYAENFYDSEKIRYKLEFFDFIIDKIMSELIQETFCEKDKLNCVNINQIIKKYEELIK